MKTHRTTAFLFNKIQLQSVSITMRTGHCAIGRAPSLSLPMQHGGMDLFPHGAQMDPEIAKQLALGMAVLCVRNTCIEDIHAGITPHSQAGDFSDAKVVTPDGEIPWNRLSRISDDEMREFMKQVVDQIYTVLLRLDDPEFLERMEHYARRTTKAWDAPKNLTNWFAGG
jgi:hypothetical protein